MSLISEKPERFHFLDGLRAVAATMVVIHHSLTSNIVRFFDAHHLHILGSLFTYIAAYGVNLFFVLSGVVLLRPYLRGKRKFKPLDYIYRRFTRIYPSYFVALLFGALVIMYINAYPTWYNNKGIHMHFSWLETVKEMAIINIDGGYYNLAWWSLGIEVLFYLLVPIIIFVYPSRAKMTNAKLITTIIAGVVITVLLQFFCNGYVSSFYSWSYQVSNIGRFIEYPVCFLMGILIAAKDFNTRHAWLFFIMGLLVIIAAQFYWPLIHSAYGLIFAAVIVFAFNLRSLRSILDTPFMIWLGERSYSLFLVHFSVFYFVDNIVAHITPERNALYGILTRGIGFPLSLFAAMLLFHFVERKFARGLVTADMFWPWQTKSLRNIGTS